MKTKILSLIAASLLLAACGTSSTTTKIAPTPTTKAVVMPVSERPLVSLTPSADGHYLDLKLEGVPSNITSIEYQVLYDAASNGSQIEKGIGDTIKLITSTIDKNLLLGTESCTTGCKYSYDTGIVGGEVTVNFIDNNGQESTFDTPYVLKTTADINKAGTLTMTDNSFSVKPKTKLTGSDYFVLMQNYRGGYSVFSSRQNSLVGNYTTSN
jgi:hypothetical protein